MTKIYTIQLLATAVIAVYVCIVLLFISKQNKLLNRLLGIHTLTFSIFYLLSFAISLQWAPDFVVLIRTFLPLYYFLPAISYLYIRSYIQDATHLSRKDLIHALPITLHLIYVSPLVYHLFTGQIQWADMVAKVDHQTYFFNYGPIPDQFHVMFKISLLITYILLSWQFYFSKSYRDFREKSQNIYSSAKRWIFFFLISSTSNGVFSLIMKLRIFYLNDKYGWANGNFISFCLILSLDFMIVYAALHPEILFGMPHFKSIMDSESTDNKTDDRFRFNPLRSNHPIPVSIDEGNQTEPVKQVDLISDNPTQQPYLPESEILQQDPQEASEITEEMRQLIAYMEAYIITKQPYRQEKFNIETLSEALDVPQHHIAYLFKQVLKKSFVDYRNELRVNHAIESLRKGLHRQITVESIGTDAGFGSKASFFTIFKKYTGKTPRHYL